MYDIILIIQLSTKQLRTRGDPSDRMSVWMLSRDPRHPEVAAILVSFYIVPLKLSGNYYDLFMHNNIFNESTTQAQYQSRLEELPEEERSLPSRRDEIFHSVVGRDGHGYTLTYGSGIPRSHIARAESSGASSSQGLRNITSREEVEEMLQSMRAAIRDEVTADVRAEIRAEMRAELAELEARLSQSRGPLTSDPTPTTQVSKS